MLLKWFLKRNSRLITECLAYVGFNEERVWVKHSGTEEESVLWEELIGVAIRTTNKGPWAPDVFWILGSKEKFLTYPDAATGEIEMLKKLQKLPGFNNEAVISAMSCAGNGTFICWGNKDFSLKLNELT